MKIGIDLGGSHIAIGLVNENYEIIEQRVYYIDNRKGSELEDYIVKSIVQGICEILKSTEKELTQIEAIGIVTPGNPQDGYITNVVNLGIKKFNLVEKLKLELKNTNIPIKLENDAKCAALAEKEIGSLKKYDDCVFLCIGTGIGGAAFLNGEFLRPKRNSGFEFGHMVIKKDGEKCNCGNYGCFEAYCSKKKFKENMNKVLNISQYVSAENFTKIIEDNINNDEVRNLLEEYIDNLTLGVANIVNILEPEAVSIGGSVSHYESLIINRLRENIYNGKYLFNKQNPPVILAASAGNDAGIIGATLIVF